MRPASGMHHSRPTDLVISRVSIGLENALEMSQEPGRMERRQNRIAQAACRDCRVRGGGGTCHEPVAWHRRHGECDRILYRDDGHHELLPVLLGFANEAAQRGDRGGSMRTDHDGEYRRLCRSVCNWISDRPDRDASGWHAGAGVERGTRGRKCGPAADAVIRHGDFIAFRIVGSERAGEFWEQCPDSRLRVEV